MKNIIKTIRNKSIALAVRAQTAFANRRGDANIGTAVSILIAVVIGALLLAGLYTLFKDNVLKTLGEKITAMFNYSGT